MPLEWTRLLLGVTRAIILVVLSTGTLASAGDGNCPLPASRAALVSRIGEFETRVLALSDQLRTMVAQGIARSSGSLDLTGLEEQVQLDPVTQFEELFGAHREASFQLQRAEDAACSRYRSFGVTALERDASATERATCISQLRAGEIPPDTYPGNESSILRRVRSQAFRKQALSWAMFQSRVARWGEAFREMQTDIYDGTDPESFGGYQTQITEIVGAISARGWIQQPTKGAVQASFDQFKLDLLDLRFDLGQLERDCPSPGAGPAGPMMIPIDTSGAAPAR